MPAAVIWLVAGVVLMVAEVLSGEFVLLMLGLAGLAGAASAAISGNVFIDVAVFAVASASLLWGVRPVLKRRFLSGPDIKTNTDALVGASAVVVSTVDADRGQVKLGGDLWTARSVDGARPLAPGTTVTVVEISGATVIVAPAP